MIERHGHALFVVVNVAILVVVAKTIGLNELGIVALHFANVAALALLEYRAPLNRAWLLISNGRVRYGLLLKTYAWYLVDSRVWFRLHGAVFLAVGAWVLSTFSPPDASQLPGWVQLVGFAVAIDFARYWIHRAQHTLPLLWRFHTMHHAPTHMTPVRAWWTHPVDDVILYSLEVVLMVALGLDPWVVLVYVSLDNTFQLLNHANVRWDIGVFGKVFQHPRYHLLHHRRTDERAVNFGEMFTLWDRFFGTFEVRSVDEMRDLKIGILPARPRSLFHQLTAPFWRARGEL